MWDYGWYRSTKPQDPLDQLARGTLEVEIFGYKMRGRWTLARMSGKDRDWLLLKKADGAALPPGATELIERYPQSVLSGLTVEEMADRPARLAAVGARLESLGAPRGEVDARAQPFTLATLAERPFSDPAWLYEIKYDGVRVLADRRGERVTLYGRSGQDTTGRYPEVARALRVLPIDRFVIDGEIVALDDAGRPSFQRLQRRMHLTSESQVRRLSESEPVVYMIFDLVALDGDCLVVCEVKTRSSLAFGAPLEAVTRQKAARLRRLAARWLAEHDLHPPEVRIDLVGVLVPSRGPVEVEHVRAVA